MSNGKICAQCKFYVGFGGWDMCCGRQVRRITYCDSKVCDEFEQNDTCTNKGESNEAITNIDYTDDFEDVHPCPYCNTMPRITVTRYPNHSVAYVYCPECQTTMTGCSMPYRWYEDIDVSKNYADQDAISDALSLWDHLYRTVFDKDGLRSECLGDD